MTAHWLDGITPWWAPKVALHLAALCWAAWILWNGGGALAPWPGQLLIVGGAAIELWHFAILRRASPSLGSPARLVSGRGLFRWIRHPMYLGDAVMVLGALWIAMDAVSAALAAGFALSVALLARDEDRMLEARFGAEFRAWAARTGRLAPRLRRPTSPR